MTPKPNEPTAEAIDAALAWALAKNPQDDPDSAANAAYMLENLGLGVGDVGIILAATVRALRAENERLKAEKNKLGNILTWIRKRVDESAIRDSHTTLAMLLRKLDEVGVAAARDAEVTQLRASLSTAVGALEKVPDKVLDYQRGSPAWSKSEIWGIERDIIPVIRLEIGKSLAQLRPLLAGRQPADPMLSETPDQREQRRVASMVWLDSLGTKQPPAKRPFCRDCADNDGTCPWTGEPCDTKQPPAAEVKAECPTCKGCAVVWCGAPDTGMPVGCPDCTSTRAVKVEEKLS